MLEMHPMVYRHAGNTLLGIVALGSLLASFPARAGSLAERLGFGPTDRVLLLQCDDLGSLHSANRASFDALRAGLIKNATVMMSTPDTAEVIDEIRRMPDPDFGIHLVATSEWKNYRWGPMLGAKLVPSLVDPLGDFLGTVLALFFRGHTPDLELEYDAQIRAALATGWKPTHLDTHEGAAFVYPPWLLSYLQLAKKYRIAPLYPRWSPELQSQLGVAGYLIGWVVRPYLTKAEEAGYLPVDRLLLGTSGMTYQTRKQNYLKLFHELGPGVTELIVHLAYADDELFHDVLSSNPEQIVRDLDARIFQDPEVIAAVEKEGLHLITWKQVQDAYPWDSLKDVQKP